MNGISNGTGCNFIVAVITIVALIGLAGTIWYITQANNRASQDVAPMQNTQQAEREKPTEPAEPVESRAGTFVGVPPKSGTGSVILLRSESGVSTVRLEDDFNVQEGPDLFVGFGNNGALDHDTLFAELKAFTGQQEYQVPDTIDTSKYNQVFIYCKEFSVDFAVATIQ